MADSREVFRYSKAGRLRRYDVKGLPASSAEVWVTSEGRAQERKSRKLMTVTDARDLQPVLESIEQELRAGGWSRV